MIKKPREKKWDRIWKRFQEIREEQPEAVCDYRICFSMAKGFKMSPAGVWRIVRCFQEGTYPKF